MKRRRNTTALSFNSTLKRKRWAKRWNRRLTTTEKMKSNTIKTTFKLRSTMPSWRGLETKPSSSTSLRKDWQMNSSHTLTFSMPSWSNRIVSWRTWRLTRSTLRTTTRTIQSKWLCSRIWRRFLRSRERLQRTVVKQTWLGIKILTRKGSIDSLSEIERPECFKM